MATAMFGEMLETFNLHCFSLKPEAATSTTHCSNVIPKLITAKTQDRQ
jgi:hypothetical protein